MCSSSLLSTDLGGHEAENLLRKYTSQGQQGAANRPANEAASHASKGRCFFWSPLTQSDVVLAGARLAQQQGGQVAPPGATEKRVATGVSRTGITWDKGISSNCVCSSRVARTLVRLSRRRSFMKDTCRHTSCHRDFSGT